MTAKNYKFLANNRHVNINKNPRCGADIICKELLSQMKLVDKKSVHPAFSKHGLANQSQVYILHNDKETGRMDIFYKFFVDFLGSKVNKKEENQNGIDAICVVAIILDQKYRTSLQLYLKRTETTRAECD